MHPISFKENPNPAFPGAGPLTCEPPHAQLTLAELEAVPDETKSYEQVGKMFLLKPLPELKKDLSDKSESCTKDVAAITEKRGHTEEAYKKIQEDFQEFVKAHMVEAEEGAAGASSSRWYTRSSSTVAIVSVRIRVLSAASDTLSASWS